MSEGCYGGNPRATNMRPLAGVAHCSKGKREGLQHIYEHGEDLCVGAKLVRKARRHWVGIVGKGCRHAQNKKEKGKTLSFLESEIDERTETGGI